MAGCSERGNELQSCSECQEFRASLSSRQLVDEESSHSATYLASTNKPRAPHVLRRRECRYLSVRNVSGSISNMTRSRRMR
jgi:hypothetical protein